MLTKEQMDTLIGRLKVYGSEIGRGKDHPNAIACRTAASVIIEQQAEIQRLRGLMERCCNVMAAYSLTGSRAYIESVSALETQ